MRQPVKNISEKINILVAEKTTISGLILKQLKRLFLCFIYL